MALIIEDGSIVDGANTYVSASEAREYAALRGLTLPATDAELETLIVSSFDYLDGLDYKGDYTNPPQPAEFPRRNLYIQGVSFPSNSIPPKLKQAQCQLCYDASLTTLQPTGDGREVVKEKVDVIEVQYAESGTSVAKPVFTIANSLLKDLLKNSAGSLTTIRI